MLCHKWLIYYDDKPNPKYIDDHTLNLNQKDSEITSFIH